MSVMDERLKFWREHARVMLPRAAPEEREVAAMRASIDNCGIVHAAWEMGDRVKPCRCPTCRGQESWAVALTDIINS